MGLFAKLFNRANVSLDVSDIEQLTAALAHKAAWYTGDLQALERIAVELGMQDTFRALLSQFSRERLLWQQWALEALIELHEEAGGSFDFASADQCHQALRATLSRHK